MLKLVKTINIPVTYVQEYYKRYPKTYLRLGYYNALNERNEYIKKTIEKYAILPREVKYFLIDDSNPNCIIGYCEINEVGEEFLDCVMIGDIVYEIAPNKRQQGYGNKILELILQEWKKQGRRRIAYVSCESENIASKKIIEANGGVFEQKFFDDFEGEGIRYTIDTSKIKVEGTNILRKILARKKI